MIAESAFAMRSGEQTFGFMAGKLCIHMPKFVCEAEMELAHVRHLKRGITIAGGIVCGGLLTLILCGKPASAQ
jgi:hypothetical protein